MRLDYLLVSDDFEKNWRHTGEKQHGGQFDNNDQAILVMLAVKEVFHFTNRQTEGFMRSLFGLMKVNLAVPDHSSVSPLPNFLESRLNRLLKIFKGRFYLSGRVNHCNKVRLW